jgi:hypothetical protein
MDDKCIGSSAIVQRVFSLCLFVALGVNLFEAATAGWVCGWEAKRAALGFLSKRTVCVRRGV